MKKANHEQIVEWEQQRINKDPHVVLWNANMGIGAYVGTQNSSSAYTATVYQKI
jgi:hypothetical protein